MKKRLQMDALIARLEKTKRPTRKLDVEIGCLVRDFNPAELGIDEIGVPGSGWTPDPDEWPLYTSSIDAALALIPPWSWRVGNLPSGRGFADLGTQSSLQCVEGATPALALCIAALKARRSEASGA
jgi:hypothetical protein